MIFEKKLYERRKERKKRKEKYKIANAVVGELNDLAYLIV